MKRAVLYLRVSTTKQTTANQERELREIAARMGCEVVRVYRDHGISGAPSSSPGRSGPPAGWCARRSGCSASARGGRRLDASAAKVRGGVRSPARLLRALLHDVNETELDVAAAGAGIAFVAGGNSGITRGRELVLYYPPPD